jgi:hypothetical protein
MDKMIPIIYTDLIFLWHKALHIVLHILQSTIYCGTRKFRWEKEYRILIPSVENPIRECRHGDCGYHGKIYYE